MEGGTHAAWRLLASDVHWRGRGMRIAKSAERAASAATTISTSSVSADLALSSRKEARFGGIRRVMNCGSDDDGAGGVERGGGEGGGLHEVGGGEVAQDGCTGESSQKSRGGGMRSGDSMLSSTAQPICTSSPFFFRFFISSE